LDIHLIELGYDEDCRDHNADFGGSASTSTGCLSKRRSIYHQHGGCSFDYLRRFSVFMGLYDYYLASQFLLLAEHFISAETGQNGF
jgi:hypothetical protein